MTGEGLWPYALAIYRRPGVEAALLELQDDHGQCAPYLLWVLWLAASGRPADERALASGAELARAWQAAAIAPLRDLRRQLRAPIIRAEPAMQTRLRDAVKTLELDAERMLLEMLEAASPAARAAVFSADLGGAIRVWGGALPTASIHRLEAALAA